MASVSVQCCFLCHLTSLQDSSVGQTSCQSVRSQLGAFPTGAAVGGDGRAVDPPIQGAVQGVDMCVETQIALGVMQGVTA